MKRPAADVTVVVPTVGRHSLRRLLETLAVARGPLPREILLVDDRVDRDAPLVAEVPERLADRVHIVPGAAGGPAAARNRGWRSAQSEWIAFLDDDVEVASDWFAALETDLDVDEDVAGVQGRIEVPLPRDRAPTDWERDVAGLERARWATADMAYRRAALQAVGGFDERFRRAYREDADLGVRVSEQVGRITQGTRRVLHPVGQADAWVSVRRQAGNADDALLRRLHGLRWRERAGIPRGRRTRHLLITGAAVAALGLLPVRGARPLALAGLMVWAVGTSEFALARIAPGPRTAGEIRTMLATSVLIPPVATLQWLRGWRRSRRTGQDTSPRRPAGPAAVLLDRDGTLIVDRPYNPDPEKVEIMPGAQEALRRLRAAEMPTAVISNQSGIARGLITVADVDLVNRRIEELLGPLGPWVICPHEPWEDCPCRKPAGGLVRTAAERLGVDPADCVVIGDVAADVGAAHAVGALAVLVPTPATLSEEHDAADAVAGDLQEAVDIALRGWAR